MSSVLGVVLPIFGLILAGYLCRRTGRLGETAAAELNRFVVWLCLPALLFRTTASARWEEIWHPGFIAAVTLPTLLLFAVTVGYRLRGRRRLVDASIDGLGAAYANTGYVGIPLSLLVLGEAGLAPALVATLIVVCVLFAIAVVCIEVGLQDEPSFARALGKVFKALSRNPLVVSPLLGALWALGGPSLAGPFDDFLRLLGRCHHALRAGLAGPVPGPEAERLRRGRLGAGRPQAAGASAAHLGAGVPRLRAAAAVGQVGAADERAAHRHRALHAGGVLRARGGGRLAHRAALDAGLGGNAVAVPLLALAAVEAT